jgi:hypothetical protein
MVGRLECGATVPRLSTLDEGDRFPDLTLEGPDGSERLSERWAKGPLVVAFERHFG